MYIMKQPEIRSAIKMIEKSNKNCFYLYSSEIISKLINPPPLIRPSVSKQVAPPEVINIMKQCWAENPDMRPDSNQIHDQFKAFNHGK